MGQITIGLDFGTHQTKVCVEEKNEINTAYSFLKFKDLDGIEKVTFPSTIGINDDNTLSYGVLSSQKLSNQTILSKSLNEQHVLEDRIIQEQKNDFLSKLKRLISSHLWGNKKNIKPAQDSKAEENPKQKDNEHINNPNNKSTRQIGKYFKQAIFTNSNWSFPIEAQYVTIWYLSFILFEIEDVYQQNFVLHFGIPTGCENHKKNTEKAVSLLLSAYYLVEDVFKNNKLSYLQTDYHKLKTLTKIIPYSPEQKENYQIYIYPEAYANLRPLTSQNKLEYGINLLIDIGGGTTDISLFTIKNNCPTIYYYDSLPKGLNYIFDKINQSKSIKHEPYSLITQDLNELEQNIVITTYCQEVEQSITSLIEKLYTNYCGSGWKSQERFINPLKNRIVLYTGGGSTYDFLRKEISYFTDVRHLSSIYWGGSTIIELDSLKDLCPILSTAYGLSISPKSGTESDEKIELHNLNELFPKRIVSRPNSYYDNDYGLLDT
jgi:hypothetical protein